MKPTLYEQYHSSTNTRAHTALDSKGNETIYVIECDCAGANSLSGTAYKAFKVLCPDFIRTLNTIKIYVKFIPNVNIFEECKSVKEYIETAHAIYNIEILSA